MRKRLSYCFLILVLALTSIFVPCQEMRTASAASITVKYGGKKYTYGAKKQTSAKINGKKISSKMPGLIIDGTNIVPVKVFKHESLGISYSYNSSKKIVTFKKDGTTLKLTMGSKIAKVNGKKVTMSIKAERMYLISNKTYYLMVPARFVAEKLGFTYNWNNAKRICTINKKVVKTPTPVVTKEPDDTKTPVDTLAPVDTVSSSVISAPAVTGTQETPLDEVEEEMKAVWISYLEFGTTKQTEAQFKKKMNTMFDNCVSYGMNTVIVQVRPFSDAMYKSEYFPWSRYASGTQGTDPGYDPLEIMVELAHQKGLKIQAWLNPYRVTLSSTSASSLADGHPAKKWMNSSNESTNRNVLSYGGNLYYNPSKSAVRTLIVNGVKEIVKNYDIDGIHFDDYFYPSFDANNYQDVFDAPEYEAYVEKCNETDKKPNSIVSWRRSNVNNLVKAVYAAVKELDSNVVFGISPAGNIDNLLSTVKYYVNIKTWMSNDNYVDYICPQIYWSFKNKVCPYAETVDRWISLKTNDSVKLYIGIAVYRAGTDVETEWKESSDVLKRQIVYGRGKEEISGFCFYRYDSFLASTSKKELQNLLPLLNE